MLDLLFTTAYLIGGVIASFGAAANDAGLMVTGSLIVLGFFAVSVAFGMRKTYGYARFRPLHLSPEHAGRGQRR